MPTFIYVSTNQIVIFLKDALAINAPSLLTATELIEFSYELKVTSSDPFFQFQTFNVLSFEPLNNRRSSGKKTKSLIASVCPLKTAISVFEGISHNLILLSSEPDANKLL